jgi:hypothetical protein
LVLTVTGGTGDAAGVSGKLQAWTTSTTALDGEHCFQRFERAGVIFTSLRRRIILEA